MKPADPRSLSTEQLAQLLGIEVGKIREHVSAGAPVTDAGNVNLVHYAAWLVKAYAMKK